MNSVRAACPLLSTLISVPCFSIEKQRLIQDSILGCGGDKEALRAGVDPSREDLILTECVRAESSPDVALVGRERELGLLRRGLDRAIRGRGSFALVSGPRGSGKSALVRQLTRDARALGMPAICAAELSKENGYVILEDPGGIDTLKAQASPSRGLYRVRRGEGAEAVLKTAVVDRPGLLIFEDIHRWGANALASLPILARNIRDSHAFAVATYSEGDLRRDPFKRSVFADLARFVPHVVLAELDEAGTRELAEALTGEPLDPKPASGIFRATAGNPLLIVQALQSWCYDRESFCSKDRFPVDRLMIPLPARDLCMSLVDGLSRESRELLNAAAVLGDRFALDILARVSGLAGGELLELIDETEQALLMQKDRERIGHYMFRHGLVRRLLYCSLPGSLRAGMHRRAASAIETLRDITPGVAAEIVEHLRLGVNDSGRGQGGKAGSGSDIPGHETMARVDFLTQLGENEARADYYDEALATLGEASDMAGRFGDETRLARIVLAMPDELIPLPGTPNCSVALIAENVLGGTQPLDAALRAQVCARLGAELSYLPEAFARAQELSDEALGIASRCAAAVQLRIRMYRDSLLRGPDSVNRRIDNAQALGDLAARIGDRTATHFALLAKAIVHLERGEVSAAESVWTRASALAGSLLGARGKMSVSLYQASHAFSGGRLEQARTLLQECAKSAVGGSQDLIAAAEVIVLREQAATEAYDTARRVAQRWLGSASYRAMLALTEIDLGLERDARFHFEGLFDYRSLHLSRDQMFLASGALLGELCVELHDLERAAKIYSLLSPYSSRFAVMGQALVLGPVSLYLGILAAALSSREAARQHLEEALRMSRSAGLRPWAAHASYHLGRHFALNGDSFSDMQSRLHIREALAEAEAMGMARLAKKARSLLGCTPIPTSMQSSVLETGNGYEIPRKLKEVIVTADSRNANNLEFRAEGDTCVLTMSGRTISMRKSKGIKLMVTLIRDPEREFHVLDLERIGHGHDAGAERCGDGGPQLDTSAKNSYRARLQDLRENLEEARRFNDLHRASILEEEIAFLARELARAVGLRGGDRKACSDAERARSRVTQAIRSAIGKISEQDAKIGWYLTNTIRTGSFCSYRPAPGEALMPPQKSHNVSQNVTP